MRIRPLAASLVVMCAMTLASCTGDRIVAPPDDQTPDLLSVASNGAERLEGDVADATTPDAALPSGSVAPPQVSLSSPADGFHHDRLVSPSQTWPPVHVVPIRGAIQVNTTASNNQPRVLFPKAAPVNLTVAPDPSACPTTPTQCWSFSAGIPAGYGPVFIGVSGEDVAGNRSDTRILGVVDMCRVAGNDPGVFSLDGTQNNRCHEIDGCSVPVNGNLARNDPFALAQSKLEVPNHAVLSTAFGAGSVPPQEFFPHGHSPAQALPCNNHDVCYQTFGTVKTACDNAMGVEMNAVCARAFPDSAKQFHPLYRRPLTPKEQRQFDRQKSRCYNWAHRWWLGLDTDQARAKFAQRQGEYRPIVS